MKNKSEEIIAKVYKAWKIKSAKAAKGCPDADILGGFLEGCLSEIENQQIKAHIIGCNRCKDIVLMATERIKELSVPAEVIKRVEGLLLKQGEDAPLLEIILALKEKTIELLRTSGDILLGNELNSLALLRSRKIKDFGREVTIVKELANLKIEAEIEYKINRLARINIKLTDMHSLSPVDELRISLIRGGKEIESYIAAGGKAVFDNLAQDQYFIEISTKTAVISKILIEIR